MKARKNKIPQSVIEAAKHSFGDRAVVEYIGKYEGDNAYRAYIPNAEAGFPTVYIARDEVIISIFRCMEALEIASLAVKDR